MADSYSASDKEIPAPAFAGAGFTQEWRRIPAFAGMVKNACFARFSFLFSFRFWILRAVFWRRVCRLYPP
ncbi:MAG: hypothetical protein ACR2P5_06220, partial [Gammaproteobacteria bacterium]